MLSPFSMTASMSLSEQLIRLIVPQDVVTLLFLIVMIGLLLFLLLRVLLPLLQISRQIRQSTEMIRALAGKSRRNVGLINDLDHETGFLNHPLLKNNWKLFKSDLQSVENHPELCEIEEYFTEDSIIHTLGKSQVAELAPGIFTTLGILGTFVGLYMGLQLFNVPADVTGDVASQQLTASTNGLIEGIKTAFQTSIYGIAFSLFFNTLYRRLVNQTRRALDDFLAAFR